MFHRHWIQTVFGADAGLWPLDSTSWPDWRTVLRGQNIAVIAGITVLHALFLLAIIWSLRTTRLESAPKELQVSLRMISSLASVPKKIDLPLVTPTVQEPPDIIVENDSPNTAPMAASASLVLAPRPDPTHPNVPFMKSDVTGAVVLRLLVMPDGSVGDATVTRSSGNDEADKAAIAYVEASWRFLPALLNGAAIQYWQIVSVPFAQN